VAFLVGRVPLVVVALWAVGTFALADGSGPWQEWRHAVSQPWLAALSRWDGRWYYYIANDGYSFNPNGESNVSFTPLLPGLMWLGGHLIGHPDAEGLLGAGVVIANIALLLALGYLFVLVRRGWGSGVAMRTLLCLLVFPTSFFLSAVYSESVFLAPAIAAFVYADEERWWLVGLCGALAALARTYGVLIVVPLAYEYLARRRGVGRHVLWLALVPAAFLGWLGYLWAVTGVPLSPLLEQAHRGRELMPPWQSVGAYVGQPPAPLWTLDATHSLADLGFVVGFGALVLLTWLLKRKSLALYSTLMYAPMVSSGLLSSVDRLGLELFPAFIVLAHLTRPRPVLAVYLVLMGALALYLTARFALGYWVG
jgi:Mannosyltransferase (PIG-V)